MQTRIWGMGLMLALCCGTVAWANVDDTVGDQLYTFGKVSLGYQGVSKDDSTAKVLPYSEQEPYPTVDLTSFWGKEGTHLRLDGNIAGEDDYLGEIHFDHKGHIRLAYREESLYHLLPRLHDVVAPASGQVSVDPTPDHDDAIRFQQKDALLKLSPALLASHLTVRYTKTDQSGHASQRYLDESCTTSQCHIKTPTRRYDQITQEYGGMLDAHLGPVEAGVEHMQRVFDPKAPIPTDSFNDTVAQHDVINGARFTNTAIKAHTSLAGGLIVAGSASVGQRKNDSDQGDVLPIKGETDVVRAGGDLTWMPHPMVHFFFRYRLASINSNVSDAYLSPAVAAIPDAIDIVRNSYAGTVAVHPTNKLTLRGGYQREDIHRSHVVDSGFWSLPEDESIDRFNVDLQYRPFARTSTRLDLGYLFTRSSDPAYAMSSQVTHRGTAALRIVPDPTWGVVTAIRAETGENGGVSAPTSAGRMTFDRVSRRGDATVNAWVSPWKPLTIGGIFGFSHAVDEQDLFFGRYGTTDALARDVESRQIVRNSSVNLGLAMGERVHWLFDAHHVRGSYEYSPEFADILHGSDVLTSYGLSDVSSLEIVQHGYSAGVDVKVGDNWNCGLKYTYDEYEDKKNSLDDGTVQTYMGTVARTW